MSGWVALFRAVNVGGTGKLEMARLRKAASAAGFAEVATYIASGNLVFASDLGEVDLRDRLTEAVEAEFGGCPHFLLRTAADMAAVAARNPFPHGEGSKVLVVFTDGEPSAEGARHQADEEIAPGEREVFVHFPSRMGNSKLILPASKSGTGRNMNTLAKLAAMASERR